VNPFSEWKGTSIGHGPTNHADVVLPSAGGRFKVQRDWLYRDQTSHHFDGGMWGIFKVTGPDPLYPSLNSTQIGQPEAAEASAAAACVVDPETGATTCPQQ
jgi:hypothetical protein